MIKTNSLKLYVRIKVLTPIVDIQYELDKIKEMSDQFDVYLKKGISMLHGIDKLYRSSPSHIKKKITTQLFPNKLIYTPNQFQAVRLEGVINLILEGNLEQVKCLKIRAALHDKQLKPQLDSY